MERSTVLVRADLAARVFEWVRNRYGRFGIDNVMAMTMMFDFALAYRAESGRKLHELVDGWDAEEDRDAKTESVYIDARTKALIAQASKQDFFNAAGFKTATANLLLRVGLEQTKKMPDLDDPFGLPHHVPDDIRADDEKD